MQLRYICIIVTLVLGVTGAVRADEEYAKLKARLDEAMKQYYSRSDAAAKAAGWEDRSTKPSSEVLSRFRETRGGDESPWTTFQIEFFNYAQAHAGQPEALEAWALTATMSRMLLGDGGFIEANEVTMAIERLCADHAADPNIVTAMDIIRAYGRSLRLESRESFYTAIEAKNQDPELIARARLARADLHLNPLLNGSYSKLFGREVDEQHVAEEKAHADEIIQSVIRDYPETKAGKLAEARLSKPVNPRIGTKLPEFEGRDSKGKRIRLSRYRGKVVMLVYWASWSERSMALFPEERRIAARFDGKPFVLLGINGDKTRDAFREVMAKEALPWPNIFDGDRKTGSVLSASHVGVFPTVYLLDHDGIIRFEGMDGERLEKAIGELIAKVPKSAKAEKSEKSATSQPAG